MRRELEQHFSSADAVLGALPDLGGVLVELRTRRRQIRGDADDERARLSSERKSMHSSLTATDLQAAAPAPDADGWGPATDATAIAQMKAAWVRGRTAYERVEGVLAPLFPDIDSSIDARYDDFMTQLGGYGDSNLFDDQGVTGMHAIERILYANLIPPDVVDFESHLPGYSPAEFPST